MDLTRENQQRAEFCQILFDLAISQDTLQKPSDRYTMYKRLEALYQASEDERFRHFYSDIFSVLVQIQQNPTLGDINILAQNLDVIRNGYQPRNITPGKQQPIDISDAIKKLYDHVNLDVARISYSNALVRTMSGDAIEQKIQTVYSEFNSVQARVQGVQKQLEKSQTDYISILGIFAAVVLAFTGGIAFSTSVLNNIAQASIYRTISVSLVIGLVLVNTLFGLFFYVNTIVRKSHSFMPLLISNVVIILLLAFTLWAWSSGIVESRNKRILKEILTEPAASSSEVPTDSNNSPSVVLSQN